MHYRHLRVEKMLLSTLVTLKTRPNNKAQKLVEINIIQYFSNAKLEFWKVHISGEVTKGLASHPSSGL